jgi:hypothetical protein
LRRLIQWGIWTIPFLFSINFFKGDITFVLFYTFFLLLIGLILYELKNNFTLDISYSSSGIHISYYNFLSKEVHKKMDFFEIDKIKISKANFLSDGKLKIEFKSNKVLEFEIIKNTQNEKLDFIYDKFITYKQS